MKPKTISEINRAFNEELLQNMAKCAKKRSIWLSVLRGFSDFLFYAAVAVIIYSVLSIDAGEGKHQTVLGYSYFTVMSSSMSDEIPKGSLIFVRHTKPEVLEIGDNITYMREGGTTITHKIVDIFENYLSAGERGFVAKGNNNANPDPGVIAPEDIIGKVVLILPKAGAFIAAINKNIHIVLIIFLLCTLLSFLLRGICNKRKGGERHEKQ